MSKKDISRSPHRATTHEEAATSCTHQHRVKYGRASSSPKLAIESAGSSPNVLRVSSVTVLGSVPPLAAAGHVSSRVRQMRSAARKASSTPNARGPSHTITRTACL